MAENVNNNITEEERLRVKRLRKMIKEELNEERSYRAGEKSYKMTAIMIGVGAVVVAAAEVAANVFVEKRKEKVELKRMETVDAFEDAMDRREKNKLKLKEEIITGTF